MIITQSKFKIILRVIKLLLFYIYVDKVCDILYVNGSTKPLSVNPRKKSKIQFRHRARFPGKTSEHSFASICICFCAWVYFS